MARDFYQDDNDDKAYHKTVALCVAAASLVVLLFLVVLYINTEKNKPKKNSKVEEVSQEDDFLANSHNFTSDELDFWNDRIVEDVEEEPEGQLTPYKGNNKDNKDKDESSDKEKEDEDDEDDEEEGDTSEKKDSDKEEDDNEKDAGEGSLKGAEDDSDIDSKDKIAVTDKKGNKKYYEILSKVDKHEYDLDKNLTKENGVLTYKDDKRESLKGIDLSKYNGQVDFVKLKELGVDFAMLRLGSRGYGTGQISLDEKFVEYAQNAALNNISLGVYFFSQAITEAEAIEEANYVVGAIANYNIKYPIAIDIEEIEEDEARTDKLTSKERTAIVKAFCDSVRGYGYKPAVYAKRDMLIAGLNIEELTGVDIWLADNKIPTDFPYKFTLWQYTENGKIDGITGDVDMDISFVNYEQR